MTPAAWLAWAGVAAVAVPMAAYWLLTLAGAQWLRQPLRYRATWIATATAATAIGAAAAGAAVPFGLACALVVYQGRRQWLFAIAPVRLRPSARPLPDDAWLAVFADGRAVAIEELRRCRLARAGHDELLVCCGLARSLVAVEVADQAPVRLHLPLPEGFALAVGDALYDGTNGREIDGARVLPAVALAVSSPQAWRDRFPTGVLLSAGLPLAPLRWPTDRRHIAATQAGPCGIQSRAGWTPLPAVPAQLPPLPPRGSPWPVQRLARQRQLIASP